MKKSAYRFERRKHDHTVLLDRRRHDADFAERMGGGIRTSSWKPRHQGAARPKPDPDDSSS
jgi:hypothetical protein